MKLTERKVEIRKAEFLAVGKACKAVFWFTQGFTEGVFGFSGERGLNFCVSGALQRGCVRGSSAWLIFLQSHTEQDCVRHTLGNDQLNGYAGPSTREWWWFLLLVSFSCVQLHWVTTIDSYPKSRIFYVHILNRIAWTHSEPLITNQHGAPRCTGIYMHTPPKRPYFFILAFLVNGNVAWELMECDDYDNSTNSLTIRSLDRRLQTSAVIHIRCLW